MADYSGLIPKVENDLTLGDYNVVVGLDVFNNKHKLEIYRGRIGSSYVYSVDVAPEGATDIAIVGYILS